MRKVKLIISVLIVFLVSICHLTLSAQDAASPTEVSMSSYVEAGKVPLNRTLQLVVEVMWQGDIDLIEIGEVEEPVLANFTILGSTASNRIMDTASGRRAVKQIRYELQPVGLGMAYIEPVTLAYRDIATGKDHALRTQRFPVEVTGPAAEPGGGPKWWTWIITPVLFAAAAALILILKRSKDKRSPEAEPVSILEESYLDQLKSHVQIKTSNKNEAIDNLNKHFRRYLAEKYQIPAKEATTEQLLESLNRLELDESLLIRCEKLFKNSDIIRFSGHQATQVELSEAYTTVESILESNLRVSLEAKASDEPVKSKGLFGKSKKRHG